MPAVYPIQVFPVDYQGAFPNMAKRDEIVWRRFLMAHGARFLGFAYNVAMGGTRYTLPDADPADVQAWQYKTALKIDAVALAVDKVWIIEVKPEAQCGALGAAVAYAMVAEREQLFDRPTQAAIVCEYVQPDVQWVCDQLGVSVTVV